ncbi:hypothetical protein [Chryseobacterium sp. YIM B08800]|uniref:hypothetical protein n=1 Tax=Chryseobacterium sp. YIM B08800 TaxID=2984136 RepID=UPI00223F7045|nr:hypothetical protein [Chryseobacterium sp. YIM B08800]
MSKRKLLINEVFKKAKEDSGKTSKNGLASFLWVYFEEHLNFTISERTFVRYYEDYVLGHYERDIEPEKLDKLSQYLDCKDFADFSRTFIKKDDETNKTTVKISVDNDEESLTEKLSNIIINITNEQNFKMPEFMKKNGMGIIEIAFLICLTTGSIAFSKKPNTQTPGKGFAGILQSGSNCMYWDKSEYKPIDCQDKNPVYNHRIPFDYEKMEYFKRIERKDTLTVDNAFGKVWYSKYNGEVDFFTDDGVDPNNGRELRKATEYIIDKYGGIQEEGQ